MGFDQNHGCILCCLNMSGRGIRREWIFFTPDIHCQFVNVSLKRLKRLSQFTVHLSNFRWNIGAEQLVVDVKDSRASKPLKSVALSDSTNVLIGGSPSIRIVSVTFRMAPSLTSYSRPNARLLGAFNLHHPKWDISLVCHAMYSWFKILLLC